jgi:hypothetical protein
MPRLIEVREAFGQVLLGVVMALGLVVRGKQRLE